MQFRKRLKSSGKADAGFTLMELAVGLVVLSIMLMMGLFVLGKTLTGQREALTLARMERVADAITIYAQQNYRVPCPADPAGAGTEPFGAERGSGVSGEDYGTSCVNNPADGILPFLTLGLPEDLARDGWGNFLTYRVSPTSAQDPEDADDESIGKWCMTRPLWHADTDLDGTTDTYVNLYKAAFCCGTWSGHTKPDRDIELIGPLGRLPAITRENVPGPPAEPGGSASEYQKDSQAPPDKADLTDTFIPVFASYVLLSHGQNGSGAFSEAGVRHTAGMGAEELENADGDRSFNVSNRISPEVDGVNLFRPQLDDIIIWDTPFGIMSRLGNSSCSRP